MAVKTLGFEYAPKALKHVGKHEAALKAANYNWTTTFALEQGNVFEDQKQLGKVTFLIIDGQLTLNRTGKPGTAAFTGRNKVIHLGVQPPGTAKRAVLRREFSVRKGGVFDLEARKEEGCTFLEGHVCLSPDLAAEMMEAGHIRWRAQAGKKVNTEKVIQLLRQTTIESSQVKGAEKPQRTHMAFKVTVPFADTNVLAKELQQWFEMEWKGYEKKRDRTVKVVTKELYRANEAKSKATKRAHSEEEEDDKTGSGSSDDESGSGSSDK